MSEIEKTVWSFKLVEDDDLSNKNIEIILNFYEKDKFELNINKFTSSFNIDLDTFLDNSKVKNDENNNQKQISDDVFQSNYHHSLILGNYIEENNKEKIKLIIEKVFTNQQDFFSEEQKEINLIKDLSGIKFSKGSVLDNFIENDDITLIQIKKIRN